MISAGLKAQQRYDVVISEIMADPSPPIGLPGVEWIELHNRSGQPVNLQGWRLADAGSQSGPMPSYTLHPGRQVIVCANSAVASLSAYGPCIGVSSFPSLDNESDQLTLITTTGQVMHALVYDNNWYQNDVKKEGGWSLEMIDTDQPCIWTGNWAASIHAEGGSPGRPNTVAGQLEDISPPRALHAYMTDSLSVIIEFSSPVDSLSATVIQNFSLINGPAIILTGMVEPLATRVRLQLADTLVPDKVYQLTVTDLTGCSSHQLSGVQQLSVGRSSPVAGAGIIINEILFHPHPNGFDYVELYHAGKTIADLSKLMIARRGSGSQLQQFYLLSVSPRLFFPGQYLVLTTDARSLAHHYLVRYPERVLTLAALPSYPNDSGVVVLTDKQGQVTDEVSYSAKMHFPLIRNPQGVALERIDPVGSSANNHNWHSAAASAGYGTPGYANSQLHAQVPPVPGLTLSNTLFTPDNDGQEDLLLISYQWQESGYMIRIRVFDDQGRPVRELVKNELMGTRGSWKWDGLDNTGRPLIAGIYIIWAELFTLAGKKELFKQPVILARR
ncbi:MAG: lamin tail domain-containing protein [Chitinophagaceae bacterium]